MTTLQRLRSELNIWEIPNVVRHDAAHITLSLFQVYSSGISLYGEVIMSNF